MLLIVVCQVYIVILHVLKCANRVPQIFLHTGIFILNYETFLIYIKLNIDTTDLTGI